MGHLRKTEEELKILREGGRKLAAIRDALAAMVRPGVSAGELEEASAELFRQAGGESSFLHYRGRKSERPYPARICVSVNDAVVHGLPRIETVFREGDVVGVDVGMKYRGLFTDTAVTVPAGRIAPEAERLIETAKQALSAGIGAVRAGATTGDVGYAIESFVKPYGFGIVRTLAGHGVGYAVHEEPLIPNFGRKGEGVRLQSGMVIAIEPMLTLGGEKLVLDPDGFTFRAADGSLTAHYEHTVAVTDGGVEVLTRI